MIGAILGDLWPYVLAVAAVVAGIWKSYSSGKKAGRDEAEVETARERAKDLDRLRSAADARPTTSLQDDPFNRDNR